ncbi:MAG: hypothetical protein M3238_08770 [Actinomycetota bacterium]|nr:hypothetical protein [Actinomycetota bacterium]
MLDRSVLRWGGMAAMVGAVLSLVFNLLHPRSSSTGLEAHIELVAESGIWIFDHYMLAWALAFSTVGLVAIGWSAPDGAGATWGRFAVASLIAGAAIGFAGIVVDGWAFKQAADAAAGGDGAALAVADAVETVSGALLIALAGSLFGLTPILFGEMTLAGREHPQWLGYLAILAGVVGIVSSSVMFFDEVTAFALNVLFTIAALLFTVWAFMMGWYLWRREVVPESRPAVSTT